MPRLHTNREYEAELTRLREQLLLCGARVEEMLQRSMDALVRRDSELAQRMIAADRDVNRLEVEIDELCLRVLARRQPVASDLRFVTLCLKVVTDLERVGDLVVNICERVVELNEDTPLPVQQELPRLAAAVQGMLREALDAFVAADAGRAQRIIAQDQAVDAQYAQLYGEILRLMMGSPQHIASGMKAQSIAKHLERSAIPFSRSLYWTTVFLARYILPPFALAVRFWLAWLLWSAAFAPGSPAWQAAGFLLCILLALGLATRTAALILAALIPLMPVDIVHLGEPMLRFFLLASFVVHGAGAVSLDHLLYLWAQRLCPSLSGDPDWFADAPRVVIVGAGFGGEFHAPLVRFDIFPVAVIWRTARRVND